jgi:hypothetical protein
MQCSHLTKAGTPCPCAGNIHVSPELHKERQVAGGRARAAQFTSESQAQARSHVKTESLVRAGKVGFAKVGGMTWWAEQTEKARLLRLENPSGYERTLREVLTPALGMDIHCDFEVILDGDPRAVDVVIYRDDQPVAAIECTEREGHATFGRDERLNAKMGCLAGLGLATHVFYGGENLQTELDRLGEFLKQQDLM